MGRVTRVEVGEMVYHVLNRANNRQKIFNQDKDYQNFEAILAETLEFYPMRILAYCLMPNHWHLVLYPDKEGELSKFMQRLTLTHTHRWHAHNKTRGYGHLYQGRYKSFPVEANDYFLQLVRYVERNPKRAALVSKAERWPWSSLYKRLFGTDEQKKILAPWPLEMPENYLPWINISQPKEEIENIQYSLQRSRPYGSERWLTGVIKKFGLANTLRDPWRPKKST